MWKELNIFLLPSDKYDKPVGSLTLNVNTAIANSNEYWQLHHLYITDDSTPKEGNKVIDIKSGLVLTISQIKDNRVYVEEFSEMTVSLKICKNIIATTKFTLGTSEYSEKYKECYFLPLPQIPKQFIECFINEYNKGNKIEKVLVEFDSNIEQIGSNDDEFFERLKLSNTNEISIKPVEEIIGKPLDDYIRAKHTQEDQTKTFH